MKIIFFGNADFGIPTLNSLNDKHDILSIVTNIDKPAGRGKKLTPTPIKKWAIKNVSPCIEQELLTDPDFIKKLKSYNPDFFIVIAYRLLPQEVFNLPNFSTINLHASILPMYRGAAPIQRAILNGEQKTGVSSFVINDKIDRGNLILQDECEIKSDDDYGSIYDRLSNMGGKLILDSINHILGDHPLVPQTEDTTYAFKIKRNETQIDWQNNSDDIINRIRAFSPIPGAFTHFYNKRIRIFKAINSAMPEFILNPGDIKIKDKNIFVGTNDGVIEVKAIQLEGKSIMNANSFINGYLNTPKMLKFENR